MACCSCQLPPSLPIFEYTKKCMSIQTTHGSTNCEVYTSSHFEWNSGQPVPEDKTVLLIIHGLGGGANHFTISEIPPILAQNDCIAVTFDLYSHGRSRTLDNKETPHDIDLFLGQIHDLIHHKDLPFINKKKINVLGFSFGGFLLLNYLLRFHKNPSQPCCPLNHCLHKVVFQSPWDGHLPGCLRGLIRIPGLLPLFKPADMDLINSYHALRHILIYADREKKFSHLVEEFTELLANYDEANGCDSSTLVRNRNHTASEILFISGDSLADGYLFTMIARKLYRGILKAYEKKYGDASEKNKRKKKRGPGDPIPEWEKRFQVKVCPGADHMTFVHETNNKVGNYYRETICNFILPTYQVDFNNRMNSGKSEKKEAQQKSVETRDENPLPPAPPAQKRPSTHNPQHDG